MRWTEDDYPDRFKGLDPDVRSMAIEIANRLVEGEDIEEDRALAIAESRAREGGSRPSDVADREGQRVEGADVPGGEEEPQARLEPDEPSASEQADPAAPRETRAPREGPEDLAPEEDEDAVERTLKEDPPPEGSPGATEPSRGPETADRDQLEHWPRDRLMEYASQRGVEPDPQIDRDTLIDRLSRDEDREA